MRIIDGVIPGGRLTIYAEPRTSRRYSLGADFAYGLPTSDYDAAVVLDDEGEQCATLEGRWGNQAFLAQLTPLIEWYKPLILGERQVGLDVLRTLYGQGKWMYYDRDEAKRSRPVTEKLGYHKTSANLAIMYLRSDLMTRDSDGKALPSPLKVRDERVLGQLAAYRFVSGVREIQDVRDRDMSMGAPHGENDDLVVALSMANLARRDMPYFEDARPKFGPGTIGHLLGHGQEQITIGRRSALTGR